MKELMIEHFTNRNLINNPLFDNTNEKDLLDFLHSHILKAITLRVIGLVRLLKINGIPENEKSQITEKIEEELKNLNSTIEELHKIKMMEISINK